MFATVIHATVRRCSGRLRSVTRCGMIPVARIDGLIDFWSEQFTLASTITDCCLHPRLRLQAVSWSAMKCRARPPPTRLYYDHQHRSLSPAQARSSCQTADRPPLVAAPLLLLASLSLPISASAFSIHNYYNAAHTFQPKNESHVRSLPPMQRRIVRVVLLSAVSVALSGCLFVCLSAL